MSAAAMLQHYAAPITLGPAPVLRRLTPTEAAALVAAGEKFRPRVRRKAGG